jgi:hypothetical protein
MEGTRLSCDVSHPQVGEETNQGVGNHITKMLPAVRKKGMRETKIIMILLGAHFCNKGLRIFKSGAPWVRFIAPPELKYQHAM